MHKRGWDFSSESSSKLQVDSGKWEPNKVPARSSPHSQHFPARKNKTPDCVSNQGFRNLILTMTYSHMGKPHTTIGDASFHC